MSPEGIEQNDSKLELIYNIHQFCMDSLNTKKGIHIQKEQAADFNKFTFCYS